MSKNYPQLIKIISFNFTSHLRIKTYKLKITTAVNCLNLLIGFLTNLQPYR